MTDKEYIDFLSKERKKAMKRVRDYVASLPEDTPAMIAERIESLKKELLSSYGLNYYAIKVEIERLESL